MEYLKRSLQHTLESAIERGKSVLLLGALQTGKSAIVERLDASLLLSLIQPRIRQRYEQDPSLLTDEVTALRTADSKKPLVIIDEVQKAPYLMDVVQDLIDRQIAQFILTSSAPRKLKWGNDINLLPGRVIPMHLNPLTLDEIPAEQQRLDELLVYGSLPAVICAKTADEKEELLNGYAQLYLEEEVRAEALVRSSVNFGRFLELAATESGNLSHYTKLSRKIGVTHATVNQYFQILEDCLITERVEPLTQSATRLKLSKTPKYLLFDMGVRRLAAHEGPELSQTQMGFLFEQFVLLELIRKCRMRIDQTRITYWRDPDGPEVDCILARSDRMIPIEVKYNERPDARDARHLQTFLSEYPQAEKAYVVCRTAKPFRINKQITAIPWQEMGGLVD